VEFRRLLSERHHYLEEVAVASTPFGDAGKWNFVTGGVRFAQTTGYKLLILSGYLSRVAFTEKCRF
jgi:hypothetical protein